VSDDNWGQTTRPAVADLMTDQLQAERARHSSLEQRGIGVVTTSGTLITLLLALAGLTGGTARLQLTATSEASLRIALSALTLAAIVGILANVPGRGRSVGLYPNEIQRLIDDPKMDIEQVELTGLERASKGNRMKSLLLLVALLIQAGGIASLAYTIWLVLELR
jgi:hypothetical protein